MTSAHDRLAAVHRNAQPMVSDPPLGETNDRLEACAKLDQSDTDNGQRLIMHFGQDLAVLQQEGARAPSYIVWSGTHWDLAGGDDAALRVAQRVGDLIQAEADFMSATPAEQKAVTTANDAEQKLLRLEKKKRTDWTDKDKRHAREWQDLIAAGAEARADLQKRQIARRKFGVSSKNKTRLDALLACAAPHLLQPPDAFNVEALKVAVQTHTLVFRRTEDPESDPDDPRFIGAMEVIAGHQREDLITKKEHGHRIVAKMTREGIIKHVMQPYATKPGQALAILKMLRVLIRHAIDIGWLKHNPSLGIRRPKGGEIRSVTEAEITAYEERWPIGTKQRLAFALFLFTGQRRSDVHRMTKADIVDGRIAVAQQKTSVKLKIRIHSDLATVLAATECKHFTLLTTEFGKPFTVGGFSGFMRDAFTAASLPLDAQPHGLRKAAGRRLAEVGCSAKQIMAVLGHKTLAEAERYTRDAEQEGLADDAIVRLEARKGNKAPKPLKKSLGKVANTSRKST